MGREVRKVPENWIHPKDKNGKYIPLLESEYSREATHYQMYETTTKGTPISPVLKTPEKLAKWLADNNANGGSGIKLNYEDWLEVIYETIV